MRCAVPGRSTGRRWPASCSSGQQMHKRDPEGHAGLREQPHRLRFGIPGGEAGFQPVISSHSSLTASAARPLWQAI